MGRKAGDKVVEKLLVAFSPSLSPWPDPSQGFACPPASRSCNSNRYLQRHDPSKDERNEGDGRMRCSWLCSGDHDSRKPVFEGIEGKIKEIDWRKRRKGLRKIKSKTIISQTPGGNWHFRNRPLRVYRPGACKQDLLDRTYHKTYLSGGLEEENTRAAQEKREKDTRSRRRGSSRVEGGGKYSSWIGKKRNMRLERELRRREFGPAPGIPLSLSLFILRYMYHRRALICRLRSRFLYVTFFFS